MRSGGGGGGGGTLTSEQLVLFLHQSGQSEPRLLELGIRGGALPARQVLAPLTVPLQLVVDDVHTQGAHLTAQSTPTERSVSFNRTRRIRPPRAERQAQQRPRLHERINTMIRTDKFDQQNK